MVAANKSICCSISGLHRGRWGKAQPTLRSPHQTCHLHVVCTSFICNFTIKMWRTLTHVHGCSCVEQEEAPATAARTHTINGQGWLHHERCVDCVACSRCWAWAPRGWHPQLVVCVEHVSRIWQQPLQARAAASQQKRCANRVACWLLACYVAAVVGHRLRAARRALLAVHVKHAATRAAAPVHSRQGRLHHHEQCADHVACWL